MYLARQLIPMQFRCSLSHSVVGDFVGLEHVDAETTAALSDFFFHLACGNTDEAFRSVRGVQSASVRVRSKMCVGTERLDVVHESAPPGRRGVGRRSACLTSGRPFELATYSLNSWHTTWIRRTVLCQESRHVPLSAT